MISYWLIIAALKNTDKIIICLFCLLGADVNKSVKSNINVFFKHTPMHIYLAYKLFYNNKASIKTIVKTIHPKPPEIQRVNREEFETSSRGLLCYSSWHFLRQNLSCQLLEHVQNPINTTMFCNWEPSTFRDFLRASSQIHYQFYHPSETRASALVLAMFWLWAFSPGDTNHRRCQQVTMVDRGAAERACKDTNPIIDGRKANVNLAFLGAKPRSSHTRESSSFQPKHQSDQHNVLLLCSSVTVEQLPLQCSVLYLAAGGGL